jgi:hypothetical protein
MKQASGLWRAETRRCHEQLNAAPEDASPPGRLILEVD